MRRMLAQIGSNDSVELLMTRMTRTANNKEFLASLTKSDI